MCRLLFIKSETEFSISEHLKTFAGIAKNSKEYQGHGWGLAYLKDNEWVHYRNIKPIWEDDVEQFPTTTRLTVHVRSAFKDQDIVVENNMPFFDDKYIFTFNGELSGVRIKEDGRIGAEKIFNFIKKFDNDDMYCGLVKGVEQIKKRTKYIRAMNIIITNKEKAFVSSLFSVEPEYFTMHKKNIPGGLIICSEKYPGEDGWEKIENNSIGIY